MRARLKTLLAIFIILLLILGCYFVYGKIATKPFRLSYESRRVPLLGSLLVKTEDKTLLPAGVCFTPLTCNGRNYYIPTFFSVENMSLPQHLLSRYAPEILNLSEFGRSISEISIGIAENYWERIELVVIVSNYQDALVAAPLAAWLNAPLIFKGSGVQGFLASRGVPSAIVIGSGDYDVGIKRLISRQAIWDFYLELLAEEGRSCNYVIITNPKDLEKDVLVPYLSLNSAILAAYRNGIVVTDDYSVEKGWLFQLGYGMGDAGTGERGDDPDILPEEEELELQRKINERAIKIDNDIDKAVEFLQAREMRPEYLALVGCPAALPMLYLKNPIWYENAAPEYDNGDEYLATDSYYNDLDIKLEINRNIAGDYICIGEPGNYQGSNYEFVREELYTQELAVGRVVAWNLVDASALVVRSLEFNEIPEFASIVTSRACGAASEPLNPDSPPRQQQVIFLRNEIPAKVFRPVETSGTHLLARVAGEYLTEIVGNFSPAMIAEANFVVYNGHGYPDGWYYWWAHIDEMENSPESIRTEDVRELSMKPNIVFSASCLCSCLDWPVIWNGSLDERRYDELGMKMFFSLALIHAGSLAHLGNTELSWGSFIGVEGYGDFDLATWYFEELLDRDLSIGRAQADSKERFIQEYGYDVFMQTCFLENVLYGEPAVNP
jgi:hypothetical protein